MHELLRKRLSEVSLEDIEALIAQRVNEAQDLEFKRQLNLTSDKDKVEAAKDATGMANGGGGIVVYGVSEETLRDGRKVPGAVTPLEDGDVADRLERLLGDVVSPRLRFQTRLIPVDSGYILLLSVQPNTGGPYMVEGYKQARYFIRSGTSTRPMDEAAVARAYQAQEQQGAEVLHRLDGLPLIPRIRDADIPVEADWPWPQPWVSVVVASMEGPRPLLPMRRPLPEDFAVTGTGRFGRPVRDERFAVREWGYEDDGTIEYDGRPTPDTKLGHRDDPETVYLRPGMNTVLTLRRLRLYPHGVFEWGRVYPREFTIPTRSYLEDIHDVLQYFATVFELSNYYGPIRVWASIDEATHAILGVDSNILPPFNAPERPSHVEVSEDTTVEVLLQDPMPLVRELMDYIWQVWGYGACHLFDPHGELRPAR
jgi:hypothetical protein